MPNPKAGDFTFDVGKAVKDTKAGKIENRTDKFGVVHLIVGKKSFEEASLLGNFREVLDEIVRAKPAAAKGKIMRSVTNDQLHGPGIPHRRQQEQVGRGGIRALGAAWASLWSGG